MAALINTGGYPTEFANQSSLIQEYVRYFESQVSLMDLQDQVNNFINLLRGPTVINRAGIRFITLETALSNNQTFTYFAQVHFVLIGDADDSATIGV